MRRASAAQFTTSVAAAAGLLAACSSEVDVGDSGDDASSAMVSSGMSVSAGGGGADCVALGPAGPCPVPMATAEAAFDQVETSCGMTVDDYDVSDINSPTLTADGQAKACASCTCRQAIFDYYSAYAMCQDDTQNANFAANLYQIASSCPSMTD